jgi:hypothetical protein
VSIWSRERVLRNRGARIVAQHLLPAEVR